MPDITGMATGEDRPPDRSKVAPVIAFVSLCGLILSLMWNSVQTERIADNARDTAALGSETHAWACIRKARLIAEHAQTKAYLESDTNGTILGFPRKLIQKSYDDQTSDLQAAAVLHCPKGE